MVALTPGGRCVKCARTTPPFVSSGQESDTNQAHSRELSAPSLFPSSQQTLSTQYSICNLGRWGTPTVPTGFSHQGDQRVKGSQCPLTQPQRDEMSSHPPTPSPPPSKKHSSSLYRTPYKVYGSHAPSGAVPSKGQACL